MAPETRAARKITAGKGHWAPNDYAWLMLDSCWTHAEAWRKEQCFVCDQVKLMRRAFCLTRDLLRFSCISVSNIWSNLASLASRAKALESRWASMQMLPWACRRQAAQQHRGHDLRLTDMISIGDDGCFILKYFLRHGMQISISGWWKLTNQLRLGCSEFLCAKLHAIALQHLLAARVKSETWGRCGHGVEHQCHTPRMCIMHTHTSSYKRKECQRGRSGR